MTNHKGQAERLMTILGERGKYQITIHLLLAFTYVPLLFNHVVMAFYGVPILHRCVPDVNRTEFGTSHPFRGAGHGPSSLYSSGNGSHINPGSYITYGQCSSVIHWEDGRNESVACAPGQFQYSPDVEERNIVSEFDLVCSNKALVSLATTIYFAGVMLGGLVFGDLADRFGRRPIMLFCLYGSIVIGLVTAFSVNYIMFVILRFLNGILIQGMQTSAYVMALELYRPKYRPFAGMVAEINFGSGVIILVGIAYFLRNWRHIQIAISLLPALTFFYICVVPESLRWLLTKGKVERAESLIERICRTNKIDVPESHMAFKMDKQSETNIESTTSKTYNLSHLFRSPKMRKTTAILAFVWFVTSTCFYGVTYKMARFDVDRYLFFFISGVVEVAVYVVSIPIMNRFGRKRPLVIAFTIAGLMCVSSGFINEYATGVDQLTAVLALIGRCALALIFGTIFVYTSELYPTIIRNIGMGFACFWARAGGVLAPQINQWGQDLGFDAIIVFGFLSFTAGVLLLPLEETHNKVLPDSIEEVENPNNMVVDVHLEDVPLSAKKGTALD